MADRTTNDISLADPQNNKMASLETAVAHKTNGEIVEHARLRMWQGPLPHPDLVARYGEIIPNGADRVMAMAELSLKAKINDSKRGPWLGASVSIIAMLGALGCVALKEPWVATVFLSMPMFAVVKALIDSGIRARKKD